MSQEQIICVGCPMGCHVELTVSDSGEITDYAGNECKKGKKYTAQEYTDPVRVFTATLLTRESARPLIPVRTKAPIPKNKIKECAQHVSTILVEPPRTVGDVVVENILDTGVDLICSAELQA